MKLYTTNDLGVFSEELDFDPYGPIPVGCSLTPPPVTSAGQYAVLQGHQWTVVSKYPDPVKPNQFELDHARYIKRAAVKDQLIAYMAADNMSRVRTEVWTVAQLASLMDDPAVAAANAYMGLLAFELAAEALATAQTPLLTQEIRADWIARLEAHFYLEG